MKVIVDINSLRANLKDKPNIALVPTMGKLHEGHLSLVREAKRHADYVVVSIFINRLQFLPNEDFDQYPRALEEDISLLKKLGVDVVFTPDEKIIYPIKQEYSLSLPPIANILEGKFRPGFFQGVETIVLKLFNIIQPQLAIFGKKDYQQFHIIRDMIWQLNLPIEIIGCETIRSSDGLALSSRNQYLDKIQQSEAPYLYQSISHIKYEIENGNHDLQALQTQATQNLVDRGWLVDYIAVQQRNTLTQALLNTENLIVLAAAWLGKTRLIDNLEI